MKVCNGKLNTGRPKVNSVLSNHLGKAQHTVAMEEQMDNDDFDLKDVNVKLIKRTTDNVIKPNKCNHTGH